MDQVFHLSRNEIFTEKFSENLYNFEKNYKFTFVHGISYNIL